MGLDK
jgi:acyl dehydratase